MFVLRFVSDATYIRDEDGEIVKLATRAEAEELVVDLYGEEEGDEVEEKMVLEVVDITWIEEGWRSS